MKLLILSSLLSALSALFVGGQSSSDWFGTTDASYECDNDWDVDFVGKSGKFKLFPCADSNFFIKVSIDILQAYNSDGTAQSENKRSSFAYASANEASGTSGDSDVYDWKNADGESITLTGVTLDYGWNIGDSDTETTMTMNLYLIEETTTVEFPDGTATLEAGSIKFDYSIENWPFENDDDSLLLRLKVTTGGTSSDGSEDSDSDGASSFSWSDEFTLTTPESYENVDSEGTSTTGDVTITYDQFSASTEYSSVGDDDDDSTGDDDESVTTRRLLEDDDDDDMPSSTDSSDSFDNTESESESFDSSDSGDSDSDDSDEDGVYISFVFEEAGTAQQIFYDPWIVGTVSTANDGDDDGGNDGNTGGNDSDPAVRTTHTNAYSIMAIFTLTLSVMVAVLAA